jgi:hypothetical protein
MAEETKATRGVMEGGGSYNRHAYFPADGARLALPLLEQAARNVALPATKEPLAIADYGSSQGLNSLIPISGGDQGFS